MQQIEPWHMSSILGALILGAAIIFTGLEIYARIKIEKKGKREPW